MYLHFFWILNNWSRYSQNLSSFHISHLYSKWIRKKKYPRIVYHSLFKVQTLQWATKYCIVLRIDTENQVYARTFLDRFWLQRRSNHNQPSEMNSLSMMDIRLEECFHIEMETFRKKIFGTQQQCQWHINSRKSLDVLLKNHSVIRCKAVLRFQIVEFSNIFPNENLKSSQSKLCFSFFPSLCKWMMELLLEGIAIAQRMDLKIHQMEIRLVPSDEMVSCT